MYFNATNCLEINGISDLQKYLKQITTVGIYFMPKKKQHQKGCRGMAFPWCLSLHQYVVGKPTAEHVLTHL